MINRVDNFSFRDDVMTREVAGSQDLRQISFTACTAYEAQAFEAQVDDNHDYEVIPLNNVPPLPPARASNPTSPMQEGSHYENLPVNSAERDDSGYSSATTPTLLLSTETSYNGEHHYEPICAPSSAATPTETTATPATAAPTASSPQDTEYDMVEHDMQT